MSIKLTNKLRPSFHVSRSLSLSLRSNRHSRCDRYRDPRLRRGGKGRNLLLLFFSLFLFPNHPGTTRCKLENIKCKVALDYAPHPSKHAFSTRVPSTIPVVFSLGAPPPPICPRDYTRDICEFLMDFHPLIPDIFVRQREKGEKKRKNGERDWWYWRRGGERTFVSARF